MIRTNSKNSQAQNWAILILPWMMNSSSFRRVYWLKPESQKSHYRFHLFINFIYYRIISIQRNKLQSRPYLPFRNKIRPHFPHVFLFALDQFSVLFLAKKRNRTVRKNNMVFKWVTSCFLHRRNSVFHVLSLIHFTWFTV